MFLTPNTAVEYYFATGSRTIIICGTLMVWYLIPVNIFHSPVKSDPDTKKHIGNLIFF